MEIIHEFENLSVTRSKGGDYYVESDEGQFLYLSPNGSYEHNQIEEWISSKDREEEDFLDDRFLFGVFGEAVSDHNVDHESWMCPECGNSMLSVKFADSWWCQDDEQGPNWFGLNGRPDWSNHVCPECNK